MAGKPDFISTHELLEETGIAEFKELQRLIRNNELPQISRDLPIPRKAAELIVKRLRGRNIDWYKYKQKIHDSDTGGPLQRRDFSPSSPIIGAWYEKLLAGASSADLPLVGVACSGGFLLGSDEAPFTIRLEAGVNILIGHRGSGKSTALTLLTMLADSTTERADVLITAILRLLKGDSGFAANEGRRIRHTLLQYGVEQYVCYFRDQEHLYAFFVKTSEGFDLLRRNNDDWDRMDDIPKPIAPPMQVLRQGEVFRIADDREKLVLNNILDGLYPDLRERRQALVRQLAKLRQQHSALNPSRFQIDLGLVEDFVGRSFFDISRLQTSARQIENVPHILERLDALLYDYDRSAADLRYQPISELLHAGEPGLLCIYVARIERFLRDRIAELRDLYYRKEDTSQEAASEDTEPSEGHSDSNVEPIPIPDDSTLPPVVDFDVDDDAQGVAVPNTLPLSSGEWRRAINEQLAQLFTFLQNRLRVIRGLAHYWSRMPKYDDKLAAMCTQFADFLKKQVELINEQEKHCEEISTVLRRDNLFIRLFTQNAAALVEQNNVLARNLAEASGRYTFLSTATITDQHRNVSDQWTEYMAAISAIRERLEVSDDDDELFIKNAVFHRVSVELRQGNSYRSFEHLSFGQRSGIILMIALRMTNAKVVVIDQPEDNLDASSVVEMIAPTLAKLGEDRVVIVATHNSNLILGLTSANLIVMESLGENGRIRISGTLTSKPEVVRQMLDVLEGGEQAFTEKMRLYEEFASRLQGAIPDVDISLIETSFRRRTIDSLRNFLQPIVSDRSIMDFLRHELKQGSVTRLRSDIANTGRDIEEHLEIGSPSSSPILTRLDTLFTKFDSHISRMLGAIEQIRLMDTQPHASTFLLFPVLREEANSYEKRLGTPRSIRFVIDSKLGDIELHVDREHFRLILRNLFENSLRATEKKAAQHLLDSRKQPFVETITVSLGERRPLSILLLVADNGTGIPPGIRTRLYVERCSDRQGADHGLGGVIIRKLLDVNGGSIEVVETRYGRPDSGTIQRLTLPSMLE